MMNPEGIENVRPSDTHSVYAVGNEALKLQPRKQDSNKYKVAKLGEYAYNVICGDFIGIITMQDVMALLTKNTPHILKVTIVPILESWKQPALVISVASQINLLQLNGNNNSGVVPLADSASFPVVEFDFKTMTEKELKEVKFEDFTNVYPNYKPEDYILVNKMFCLLAHLHKDRFQSESPRQILFGFDEPKKAYFFITFGYTQPITLEDFARIFSLCPARIVLLGYDFQMKKENEDQLGALVVQISVDELSPNVAAFNMVPVPKPSPPGKRKIIVEDDAETEKNREKMRKLLHEPKGLPSLVDTTPPPPPSSSSPSIPVKEEEEGRNLLARIFETVLYRN